MITTTVIITCEVCYHDEVLVEEPYDQTWQPPSNILHHTLERWHESPDGTTICDDCHKKGHGV